MTKASKVMATDDVFCREKLERAVEAIAEGVVIIGREAQIIFANAAAEHIFGSNRSQFIGRPITDLTKRITAAGGGPGIALEPSTTEAREEGSSVRAPEYSVEHPDGTRIAVTIRKTPLFDPTGSVAGAVITLRDITDYKKVEEDLRFKSMLLDNAVDSVFVRDNNDAIIYANEAAHATRGYTREELMSLTFEELNTPEYATFAKNKIAELTKETSTVYESAHSKKDGSAMQVEIHACIVEFDGETFVISIVRDISERKRIEKLSDALDAINTAISSTLDFDEIMQRVVVEAAKAIGCETSAIDLCENGQWVVKYLYGLPLTLIGTRFSNEESRHSVLAAQTRRPLVINDARTDERVNPEIVKAYNLRSMMVIPLVARDEVIGVIFFSYHSEPIPFDEAQVDFANKLAAGITLAIENSRLYEAERVIADTLQEALLTVPQKVKGIDFGYLYRSATESARVGGDFYDLFELEGNRVGIVIGDVSGKGLDAAALTSLVKNTIRAYAYQETSPCAVMTRANDVITKMTVTGIFVTVLLGVLDTETGEFVYCSCGHPPAIVKRKTGEISILSSNSPAVGAFANLSFIDEYAALEMGDVLTLYTDGVTEAQCDGKFFGEERLIALIRGIERPTPDGLPKVIYDELMKCTGKKLSDDVAVLSIALSATAEEKH